MTKSVMRLFVFVSLLHCVPGAVAQKLADSRLFQTEERLTHSHMFQAAPSYEHAMRDSSSSPLYVSITIIDARTGAAQHTCVFGQDLLTAIHREYSLSSDAAGRAKALDIALNMPERKFQFWSQDALDAMPLRFSETDLGIVRARFASISDEDIRSGFAIKPWGRLHEAYREPRYRDAAACVLIERGMAPAVDDRSRALYLP